MATPNMGLGQTQQGVTPAPTYAQLIDANWPLVDQHNHAPGAGVLVPTAGLNINADLNFNSHAILAASSVTTGNLAAAALTANLNLGGYALSNGGSLALTGAGTALTVSNNALVSGNLSVTGTLAAGSLSLTNLTVTGTSTLATVTASGTATFNGGIVMGGIIAMAANNITNANIISAAQLNATNVGGFTSTGNIALGGNTISGGPGSFTTLGASGNLSVTGTTSLTGTLTAGGGSFATGVTFQGSGTGLTVNNNATITGTLTAGGLSLATLTLTGAGTALTVNNNATITGTLTAGTLSTTNLSLSGTLGVTGTSTLAVVNGSGLMTLSHAGSSLSVAGSINEATASTALSLIGNAAAASGVGTILDNTTAQTSGKAVSIRTGGTEVANFDYQGTLNLVGGGSTTTLNASSLVFNTGSTVAITSAAAGFNFNAASGSQVAFNVAGSTILQALSSGIYVTQPILENTASSALTLSGFAAATGGVGTILDNRNAQTSGTVTSFRTGGTEVANVDYAGDLTITGTFIKTTNSILNVTGNAPATSGNALIINNAIPQTSGNIVSARTANVEQAIITATGDFKPYGHYRSKQTTAPTFTAVNAVFVGATVAFTAGSNDCAGQITVTTTVATGTVSAGAAAFSVNFYQNYTDNFPVVILLPNNTAAGALGITFFTTGNNSGFNVCPSTSWSPAEVAYAFKYWVIDVS